MYAISLTSIPPRFDRLGPVLMHLLAQDPAPQQVIVCLPRQYRRFPGTFDMPNLPSGVTLMWSEEDFGPATKVLPAARVLVGTCDKLIYCDDDWLMSPDWAASLLAAHTPGHAVTGAGYSVARLGRASETPAWQTDIAQGFAGVLVNPLWFADADINPPEAAWPVDDIWLSGHLARQGISVTVAQEARAKMRLAYDDTDSLQKAEFNGKNRDIANRACAALIHKRYGIWPPLD